MSEPEFSTLVLFAMPKGVWWTIGVLTVVTTLCSIVVLPMVVIRMADDYFLEERDPMQAFAHQHPVVRVIILVAKNVLGIILLIAGFIMFFTPGQGFLTVLMGLVLTDFPKKRKLELRIISIPAVHKGVNWIRRKANKPPLRLPPKRKRAA